MKYLKSVMVTFLVIFFTTILFGSLGYFNILNEKALYIIQTITLFIIIILESYNLGKNKEKKGYVEGLIYGVIIVLLFFIINLIFNNKIDVYKIIYYLIIICISTFSSIIGINKKMKD